MAFPIVSLYPEFQYMPTYLATLEARLSHLTETCFIPKAVQVGLWKNKMAVGQTALMCLEYKPLLLSERFVSRIFYGHI